MYDGRRNWPPYRNERHIFFVLIIDFGAMFLKNVLCDVAYEGLYMSNDRETRVSPSCHAKSKTIIASSRKYNCENGSHETHVARVLLRGSCINITCKLKHLWRPVRVEKQSAPALMIFQTCYAPLEPSRTLLLLHHARRYLRKFDGYWRFILPTRFRAALIA